MSFASTIKSLKNSSIVRHDRHKATSCSQSPIVNCYTTMQPIPESQIANSNYHDAVLDDELASDIKKLRVVTNQMMAETSEVVIPEKRKSTPRKLPTLPLKKKGLETPRKRNSLEAA